MGVDKKLSQLMDCPLPTTFYWNDTYYYELKYDNS
jgi:hypothetical protein